MNEPKKITSVYLDNDVIIGMKRLGVTNISRFINMALREKLNKSDPVSALIEKQEKLKAEKMKIEEELDKLTQQINSMVEEQENQQQQQSQQPAISGEEISSLERKKRQLRYQKEKLQWLLQFKYNDLTENDLKQKIADFMKANPELSDYAAGFLRFMDMVPITKNNIDTLIKNAKAKIEKIQAKINGADSGSPEF